MALVGDNGAGKSTLIKCVAGIYSIDSGEVLFDGKRVDDPRAEGRAKLGIEVVYQDLALCDNLDVVQNMYLGREERDRFFRLARRRWSSARARRCVVGGDHDPLRSAARRDPLGRQRQSVAVARAVMWNNRSCVPRRANRCARRCPDPAGARAREAARRAGACGRHRVAQPRRHLRGFRPHHRPSPGPQRRRLREGGETSQQEIVQAITAGQRQREEAEVASRAQLRRLRVAGRSSRDSPSAILRARWDALKGGDVATSRSSSA